MAEESSRAYMLVTGATSGVGTGICYRLIDEFVATRPSEQSLCLILAVRSEKKADATISSLQNYLIKKHGKDKSRILFVYQSLELTSLSSVYAASQELLGTIPRIDALILNAGTTGPIRIDWPRTVWGSIVRPVQSLTWPDSIYGTVGRVTPEQFPSSNNSARPEPPLGELFCGNLFGHYCFAHYLMPLLSKSGHVSRIIWVSSIEAQGRYFDIEDPQGILSQHAYQSSKRLTDLLVTNAESKLAKVHFDSWCSSGDNRDNNFPSSRPHMYITHPGLVQTNIVAVSWIMAYIGTLGFLFARLCGSPWHTLTVYNAAISMVWLALASQATLDGLEAMDGKGKWGSATDIWGEPRVKRTYMDGWGLGGRVGEESKLGRYGRKIDAKDLSEGETVKFEEIGAKMWQYMENLRKEWDEIRTNAEGKA